MHTHNHSYEHVEDGHTKLSTNRLEAFSDGVLAIIITIAVLNFKVPEGSSWSDLATQLPLFLTYIISFQTIGIYWNNHHHLLRATKHVSTGMMWANLNLLFWISLIPFATAWVGENHGGAVPTAVYASILFFGALAYTWLENTVVMHAENRQQLEAEIHGSWKGAVSVMSYIAAIGLAFVNPIFSDILIVFVALIWFVPDRRIVRSL